MPDRFANAVPSPGQPGGAGRGALGTPTNSPTIDKGTASRQATPAPGPQCVARKATGPEPSIDPTRFVEIGINPWTREREPLDQLEHLRSRYAWALSEACRDPNVSATAQAFFENVVQRLDYLMAATQTADRVKERIKKGKWVDEKDIGELFSPAREEAILGTAGAKTAQEELELAQKAIGNNAKITTSEFKQAVEDLKAGRTTDKTKLNEAAKEAVKYERQIQLFGGEPDRPDSRALQDVMNQAIELGAVVPPVYQAVAAFANPSNKPRG